MHNLAMHSQNNEEKFILDHFAGTTGRFYDIGAFNGMALSNTMALLERGWSGVEVEPGPRAFLALCETMKRFRERVTLVNAPVSPDGRISAFWESGGDMLSTLSAGHRELWDECFPDREKHFVKPVTPSELFDTFGPAEFISLDVEGLNMEVFRELPFEWPELTMVCVELQCRDNDMADLAAEHGFRELHRTSENLLLVR